jgi:hypothetical protein
VFYGMLGVTFFGLVFTPVFYVVIAKFMKRKPNVTKSLDITPDALA